MQYDFSYSFYFNITSNGNLDEWVSLNMPQNTVLSGEEIDPEA